MSAPEPDACASVEFSNCGNDSLSDKKTPDSFSGRSPNVLHGPVVAFLSCPVPLSKLENFEITIIPPSYSKLPSESLDGSIAVIQGLKGSTVKITCPYCPLPPVCRINLPSALTFLLIDSL